jgi:hypothetical protein
MHLLARQHCGLATDQVWRLPYPSFRKLHPTKRHRGHSVGAPSMCDYSLEHLASRPAKVGDKLVTTKFGHSLTGGFCAVGEPNVAVCLKPGTELAFEREIETLSGFWKRSRNLGAKVARFRRLNEGCPTMHHDALEIPGGQVEIPGGLRRPTRDSPPAARVRAPARGRGHAAAGSKARRAYELSQRVMPQT